MTTDAEILISTQCFPPDTGGIEMVMYALASTLSSVDRVVRVYADKVKGGDQDFDLRQTYTTIRYSGLKPWRRRKKARDISAYAATQHASPPALITDTWKSLEHISTQHFSRVICLVHGTEIPINGPTSKLLRIRNALSKASYIVANSKYTAERVHHCLGYQDNLRVILPGIAEPVVDNNVTGDIAQRLAHYDPILITLARLEERKGHLTVISLLPMLIKEFPGLLYIIAGEGSCKPLLMRQVEQRGLGSHVLFTGTLGDPEKSAWLANSTLFIMPGKQIGHDVEGFGLAYIEAALQGIPAIATDIGGAPEAVLHLQTGLICPADSPDNLLKALHTLLRDRQYCHQLGKDAQYRARHFLWPQKCHEFLALLDQSTN